jgi:hypothetical protein
MSRATIDRLIINSPYEEPSRHWHYERETRRFSPDDCGHALQHDDRHEDRQ